MAISLFFGWLTYRAIRQAFRWLTFIVLAVIVIRAGMPMSKSQRIIMSSARSTAVIIQNVFNTGVDTANQFAACMKPARVFRNRVFIFLRANIQLIAQAFGYDFGNNCDGVSRGLRQQRATIVASTFCGFMNAVFNYLQAFVELIMVPFLGILQIIVKGPTSVVTLLEAVQDLLRDQVLAALNLMGCTGDDMPYDLFVCLTDRFSSASAVPRNTVFAFLMVLDTLFDPNSGTVLESVDRLFGAVLLAPVYNTIITTISGAWGGLTEGILDLDTVFGRIIAVGGFLGDLDGTVDAIRDELDEWLDDLLDVFRAKGHDGIRSEINAVVYNATVSRNATRVLYEMAIAVPSPMLISTVTVSPPRGVPPPRRMSDATRFMRAHNATMRAIDTAPNFKPHHRMAWRQAASVLYDVVTSSEEITSEHIHQRFARDGINVLHLARMDSVFECAPPSGRDYEYDTRRIDLPPVLLANNAMLMIGGGVVLFFTVLLLGIAFPFGLIAIVFVTTGLSIFLVMFSMITQSGAVITAFTTGDINQVAYLQTIAAFLQQVGADYFDGGAERIDPFAAIDNIAPYIEADMWFTLMSSFELVLCATPFLNLCPPPMRRGDTAFDRLAALIQCIDNQPCNTIGDCCGQASQCFNNKCLCYGIVQEDVEYPKLEIESFFNIDCRIFGYRTDDQSLDFSFYNAWVTFDIFCTAVRDAVRLSLEYQLVEVKSIGAYLLIFIPVFAAFALTLGKPFALLIIGQQSIIWIMAAGNYLGLDRIGAFDSLNQPPPTYGRICIFTHTPAIAIWLLALSIIIAIGYTVLNATAFVFTVFFVRAYRASRFSTRYTARKIRRLCR